MKRKTKLAPRHGDLALYDGQQRLGSITSRGKDRFEAFDAVGRSLGVYPTTKAAAAAIDEVAA
jgi:hypothetical protein